MNSPLVEPTPEEICTQYTNNHSNYVLSFLGHRSIPVGFIINLTQNPKRMAENSNYLRFLSNMCNNEVNLKSHRTGLTAYFGRLLRAPFEEALAFSKHFQSGLAKSYPGKASEKLQRCNNKATLDAITCIDSVPLAKYLFQIGVKHVSVSLPVLTTIQDQMRSTVAACRSGINDTAACLKESKLEKAAAVVDNFCSQYFKMELPAFKTKNHLEFQGNEPKSQAWIDLTTSCCFQH
ncbi:hypothetical protein HF521_014677 [Silurus meridionalis]|uniref:Uncharacterized protein n=1 Tax=Silurus meridionalis TaxID=175797 RepID=A0A8T0A861_SILME|nr:hypothetical protein HF521_014677 [Silurus meridionalis]